jgi:hypothetical protein
LLALLAFVLIGLLAGAYRHVTAVPAISADDPCLGLGPARITLSASSAPVSRTRHGAMRHAADPGSPKSGTIPDL